MTKSFFRTFDFSRTEVVLLISFAGLLQEGQGTKSDKQRRKQNNSKHENYSEKSRDPDTSVCGHTCPASDN